METARDEFEKALQGSPLGDPTVPVYANVSAEPVRKAADAQRLLLEQLTAPVRWTQVVERLAADHPGALFVEMGPGSVLTGLAKKIAPSVECVSCGTPDDVESLLARVS